MADQDRDPGSVPPDNPPPSTSPGGGGPQNPNQYGEHTPGDYPPPVDQGQGYPGPQGPSPQYGNPQYSNPQYSNPQYGDPRYSNPGAGLPPFGMTPQGGPRPRKKRTMSIVLAAIAALVVAGVVALVVQTISSDDIGDVEAGDCIAITGANTDVSFETVGCGDAGPLNFIVADTLDSASESCGGTQYPELTQTRGEAKLCLVPNFQQGRCYEVPMSSLTGMKEVDCNSGSDSQINSVVKVTLRVESTTVPDCAEPVTYDKPTPLGFCMSTP